MVFEPWSGWVGIDIDGQYFDQLYTLNFRIFFIGSSFWMHSTHEEDHNTIAPKWSPTPDETEHSVNVILKSQTCRLGLFTVSSSMSSTADTVSMRSSFRLQNPGEIAQQVPAAPGNRGKPRLFENCWHLQSPTVKLKIEKVALDECARLRLCAWRAWQLHPMNWKRG